MFGMIVSTLSPITMTNTQAIAAENTKTITINETKVDIPVKGYKWFEVKGKTYFALNGALVKGWKVMDKSVGEQITHWSFFNLKTGELYKGWHSMGKTEGEKTAHWSYFGSDGWLRTGWQKMGKGTQNSYEEQTTQHWSWFGTNGWLQTGWKEFTKTDGEKPHWSYFGDNGWIRTGLQDMGKGTKNPDGNNKKHKSYFDSNGWLAKKKTVKAGGKTYWANESGWCSEELYSTNERKTIIIGDSRTVFSWSVRSGNKYTENLVNTKHGKEYWIAKPCMGYDWFVNTALPIARNIGIGKDTDIVICMGVNDYRACSNANTGAYNQTLINNYTTKYANLINSNAKVWVANGARVYYASVGCYGGHNAGINAWNNTIKRKFSGNVRWIATPNLSNYYRSASDKLHYSNTGSDLFMSKILAGRW